MYDALPPPDETHRKEANEKRAPLWVVLIKRGKKEGEKKAGEQRVKGGRAVGNKRILAFELPKKDSEETQR